MSDRPVLAAKAAAFGYDSRLVLSAVDCVIPRGSVVGIVGPNGSGKTTFLKAVLGKLAPRGGTFEVDRLLRFAYVPQREDVSPFWPLTVRQTVELPVRALGSGPEGLRRAAMAMAQVGVEGIAERLLSEVSGGQRQRAILAQAMAQDPQVLLLDEPTRGLDADAESAAQELIRRLRGSMTILVVTHDAVLAESVSDQLLRFRDGAVSVEKKR